MAYKNAEQKREAQRRWYKKHHEKIRDKLATYRKQNKANVRKWFRECKEKLECARCKENHPACLHFHHRIPSEKRFSVATAVASGLAIATIEEEMKKCDVLCANCHAKEHHKDYGVVGRVV